VHEKSQLKISQQLTSIVLTTVPVRWDVMLCSLVARY